MNCAATNSTEGSAQIDCATKNGRQSAQMNCADGEKKGCFLQRGAVKLG